jgi:hypothetical protein
MVHHLVSFLGVSRLGMFEHDIPRREIDALWCMIGWFSSTPTLAMACCTKSIIKLLTLMLQCNSGIFPNNAPPHQLTPDPKHMETCCREIEWVATLISSKSLGEVPDLDSFVIDSFNKAVRLESKNKKQGTMSSQCNDWFDVMMLNELASTPYPQMEDCTSSIVLFELSSLLVPDETTNWRLAPSRHLIQTSSLMLKEYTALAMPKKAKWKRFSRNLDAVLSTLKKDAIDSEIKSAGEIGLDFASAFSTDEDNQLSSHLRETSCFIILSCLIARSNSTSATSHVEVGLNKHTREQVS